MNRYHGDGGNDNSREYVFHTIFHTKRGLDHSNADYRP